MWLDNIANGAAYSLRVENDGMCTCSTRAVLCVVCASLLLATGIAFLEQMRKRNAARYAIGMIFFFLPDHLSSYVHVAPFAVGPMNLSVVRDSLRTPMGSTFSPEATRARDAVRASVLLGPWPQVNAFWEED